MRTLIALTLLVGCSGSGAAAPAASDGAVVDAEVIDTEVVDTEVVDTAVAIEDTTAPTETAAPPSCADRVAQPLDQTLTIDGGRAFAVHVPKSYDPKRATPLVLDFHGLYGDENQEEALTRMNVKSDAAGFISVHPRGTGRSWNAGACCGEARTNKVDDVGFVKKMLDELEKRLCVDKKRIFSTGMSNGGFLSHRLGCELADRVAAIAPVAAVMGMPTCTPSRKVPIMHFHGTSDSLVPYAGNPSISYPSVADSIAGWAKRDGCTGTPKETYKKGEVHCETYQGCPTGVDVTLCTVDGGGHTWPGGGPAPFLGHITTNISATDAMWEFFVAHPME